MDANVEFPQTFWSESELAPPERVTLYEAAILEKPHPVSDGFCEFQIAHTRLEVNPNLVMIHLWIMDPGMNTGLPESLPMERKR